MGKSFPSSSLLSGRMVAHFYIRINVVIFQETGMDIDVWTLEDLKSVVRSFKDKHPPPENTGERIKYEHHSSEDEAEPQEIRRPTENEEDEEFKNYGTDDKSDLQSPTNLMTSSEAGERPPVSFSVAEVLSVASSPFLR
jgi:hypothetical protein